MVTGLFAPLLLALACVTMIVTAIVTMHGAPAFWLHHDKLYVKSLNKPVGTEEETEVEDS